MRPYVTPQELKDSIPLDGCIQNYDSAYHIIFTNVKTIQQFSPRTGGGLPPANKVAELEDGLCAGTPGVVAASWQASGSRIV